MIRTEALSFRYPDGTEALHELNLEIRDGEFLALMGANGCGKTTLLKHLIGLLKPSSGRIFMNGKEFRFFQDREIFTRVGMVFQDPNDQLFASTVEQDAAFGAINLGLNSEEVSRRTSQALKMVEAFELAGRAIHTLSFGQKRRVAIAGVLAMEPKIILLDEPTGGLDPRVVSSIMQLLRKLNKEKEITMVMATHDVELVPLFCDRVAIMSQGRIIGEGTPESIFANIAMLREAGLRLPRIGHLIEILQREDRVDFQGMPLTIAKARQEILRFVECRHTSSADDLHRLSAGDKDI